MRTKNILIVDDEYMTRNGLKSILERDMEQQLEVKTASDSVEALEIIMKETIHLLILDIHLPEESGLQFLSRIKKMGYHPVSIIISGYADFSYAQEAIRLGVINFLLKPLSKDKFLEATQEAIRVEENLKLQERIGKTADLTLLKATEQGYSANTSVEQAIEYLQSKIQYQITLKDVAERVHLNASYLSVLFKEKTGVNFSEYVTRMRIQEAKKLLLNTSTSIEVIAQMVGYQNSKYFIKVFKDYEHMTPNKYRKEYKD
jgi:two-component system response regulator YesN